MIYLADTKKKLKGGRAFLLAKKNTFNEVRTSQVKKISLCDASSKSQNKEQFQLLEEHPEIEI